MILNLNKKDEPVTGAVYEVVALAVSAPHVEVYTDGNKKHSRVLFNAFFGSKKKLQICLESDQPSDCITFLLNHDIVNRCFFASGCLLQADNRLKVQLQGDGQNREREIIFFKDFQVKLSILFFMVTFWIVSFTRNHRRKNVNLRSEQVQREQVHHHQ